MSTACCMETKNELLHSRLSSFSLSNTQPMPTTMHLKVLAARAQLADHISLLISNIYCRWHLVESLLFSFTLLVSLK